jgi:hypothetical protein
MNKNNNLLEFVLSSIEEPCYYDFLYQEIKHYSSAEMLNIIFFEAILRIDEIKNCLNSSYSYEDITKDFLEKNANGIIKNPLYERIESFKRELKTLTTTLNILDSKENNIISKNELIDIFFNKHENKYKTVLNTLKEIDELINTQILPNIESDISLDDFQDRENKRTSINPFEIFNKYGLDFNEFIAYQKELERYIKDTLKWKKRLLKREIDLKKYKYEVSLILKKYIKVNYFTLYKDNQIMITYGKRPLSRLLNNIIFKIPYSTMDKAAQTRLKKALETFKKQLTKRNLDKLEQNTSYYLKYIEKELPDILSMTPERFARTLFIYDWLNFIENRLKENLDDEYFKYTKSYNDRIHILQIYYPNTDIEKNKVETLIKEFILLRNFIQSLSKNIKNAT